MQGKGPLQQNFLYVKMTSFCMHSVGCVRLLCVVISLEMQWPTK